ncbi:MAG: hypothetical protein A2Y38_16180 [Spirochaetes bacterium GWB1_59_5]|nr:MAG: hypothetical protein A2Y38_16180 [Spirochaetes bacterium GWB1_59_5]
MSQLRSQFTGVLTESGVIFDKPCKLVGWTARVTSDSTIQIYKGVEAGEDSEIISEIDILATDKSGGVMGINGESTEGLYLKITGNARVCAYFQNLIKG